MLFDIFCGEVLRLLPFNIFYNIMQKDSQCGIITKKEPAGKGGKTWKAAA